MGDALATAALLRQAGLAVAFLPLLPVPAREADAWNLEALVADLIRQAARQGVEPHVVLEAGLLVGGVGGLDLAAGLRTLRRVAELAAERGGFLHVCLAGEEPFACVLALVEATRGRERTAVGVGLSVRLARLWRRVVAEAREGLGVLLHDYERTLDERPLPREAEARRPAELRRHFVALAREAWARGFFVTALTRDLETLAALDAAADEAGAGGRYEALYRLGDRAGHLRRAREAGRAVRVLVPFGPDWAPYLTARLAEWPWDAGARPARR